MPDRSHGFRPSKKTKENPFKDLSVEETCTHENMIIDDYYDPETGSLVQTTVCPDCGSIGDVEL